MRYIWSCFMVYNCVHANDNNGGYDSDIDVYMLGGCN